MWRIFGLPLLPLLFALGHSQRFVPIDRMTEQDLENWVKPPSRQVFQRILLDRMLRTMDPRADPCEDFYQYACGNYDAVRPQNFSGEEMLPLFEVKELSTKFLNSFIQSTAKFSESESERKMRDFYRSCMEIKRDPHTPIDYVRSFGSWPAFDQNWRPQSFDWMQRMVELMKVGINVFFKVDVLVQNRGKVYLDTGNLIFKLSDLYEKSKTQRELLDELRSLFSGHLPVSYVVDMSNRISTFHNQLHQLTKNPPDESTFKETYIQELPRTMPSCHLARFVSLLINEEEEPTPSSTVITTFDEQICALLERTDKRTVADTMLYYLYAYAQNETSSLKNVTNERLQTHCLEKTKELLQPVLAKMFVEQYVPRESRVSIVELSEKLRKVGVEMMMSETKWLDETTRRRSTKKMGRISTNVVYPLSAEVADAPLANVVIDVDNYLENVRRLKAVSFENKNRILGKPYGSLPFDTLVVNPHILNAFGGHIRLQAAALLPPAHSIFAPSFHEYGTLGLVLGHEHMHAFDVGRGVDWDEFGNETKLISPVRQLVHHMRSECFYTQFEDFKITGTDIHVLGAKTMAENVADNDGIKMAYKLFRQWMAENPDIVWQEEFSFAPLQLNHEQAFFLSYGQLWCDHRSFEELVKQVKTDEHSPGKFRVVGGVSNSRDFARAFNCPANSKMNPSEKCNYFFD